MRLCWLTLLLFGALPVLAAEARVAVATNFLATAERLAADFERTHEHRVTLVGGSTGKFYAQIVHGAPYDVFLAADRARPERLEREGRAVPGSRRTYAVGRLVLWSADPDLALDAESLRVMSIRRLALANPALAPYGAAARETLRSLALFERLSGRIVLGENVAQVKTMVATGNADLGFVARAHLLDGVGSGWEVPARYHAPIRQDGVLLERGRDNVAARAFLNYLTSEAARATIERAGYDSR